MLEKLKTQLAALIEEIRNINNTADTDDRDLTEDEMATVTAKAEQVEKLKAQIEARERSEAAMSAAAGTGRRTQPADDGGSRQYRQPRDPKAGFKTFGHFAQEVMAASGKTPDQDAVTRLSNAASTWGGENTGADGGFAVPPEFRSDITKKLDTPTSLLTMCDRLVTSSNSITLPKDETTPWQGTGGIQAYWENEAATIPASKPQLEQSTIRLNKLTALVPVSDELLEDAAAIDSYLRAKAPDKMIAKLNTAIVNGTGAGQPKGILNSLVSGGGSVVVTAAEGSQATATVLLPNIIKMWRDLYAGWRQGAVWLINQDVEPQLGLMDFRTSATAPSTPIPVYMPGNTIQGDGFDTLKGKPVIPVEACSALGSVGDIILVNLKHYMTATKGQDIRTDVSIHLYFDQDLTAFRFIMRVAGQPWWSTPIVPQNSSNNRSWAVTLAARP